MHQQAHGPNSIQIEGSFKDSPVCITQKNTGSDSRPHFVRLEFDRESIQRYPKGEVESRALRGGIVVIGSFLAGLSPHFADWIGIFNQFGVPGNITVIASVLVGCAIVSITGDRKFIRWRLHRPKKANEPQDLGAQKFLEIDDDGNYVTYSRSASCTYPYCGGKIIVTDAPEREKHRWELVGICSVEGKKHSYVIDDHNAVAREAKVDWSPKDPPTSYSAY